MKAQSGVASSPTILISAYRNAPIRHILYSDIFNELKKSGCRLVANQAKLWLSSTAFNMSSFSVRLPSRACER